MITLFISPLEILLYFFYQVSMIFHNQLLEHSHKRIKLFAWNIPLPLYQNFMNLRELGSSRPINITHNFWKQIYKSVECVLIREYMELKWLRVVVLMMSILVLEAGLSNGCLEQERLALLQLKSFFKVIDAVYWTSEEDGSDCCQWEWVECNITTGRVITLSLDYKVLQWTDKCYLNASVFLPFEELRSLYLNGNHIAGFVENEDG